MDTMFTIKAESEEGTYYLCNHWYENRTFWIYKSEIRPNRLFKSVALAKRSLKHLLELMEEDYINDKFTIVEIVNGNIIEREKFIAKDSRKGYWDKPEISFVF